MEDEVAEQVEIQAKYQGYIDSPAGRGRRGESAQESARLPANLDYSDVRGLSNEVQQKLARQRPETIGQAARISGVTPAAISLLLVHLKRRERKPQRRIRRKKTRMTPQAALRRGLGELALALPAGAPEKLLAYLDLLAKWNKTYNLTAIRDPLQAVSHHLLDSLAVLRAPAGSRGALADVGSGGGLPGFRSRSPTRAARDA